MALQAQINERLRACRAQAVRCPLRGERRRWRRKLEEALRRGLGLAATQAVRVWRNVPAGDYCAAMEEHLYHELYFEKPAFYAAQLRRLCANLGANGRNLLWLEPTLLASLDAQGLAYGSRVARQRDAVVAAIRKEVEERQRPIFDPNYVGMYQCPRCRSWATTYYQLQTRSADEPMTIFVTCSNCSNRFKRY